MPKFELDTRLAGDALPIAELNAGTLLLMNDKRWPWLILVPRLPGASEWHDVDREQRSAIDTDVAMISKVLKQLMHAQKINIAMLGNIVSQLHVHVIARNTGDPNWPGPVWGYGDHVPYDEAEAKLMIRNIQGALVHEN